MTTTTTSTSGYCGNSSSRRRRIRIGTSRSSRMSNDDDVDDKKVGVSDNDDVTDVSHHHHHHQQQHQQTERNNASASASIPRVVSRLFFRGKRKTGDVVTVCTGTVAADCNDDDDEEEDDAQEENNKGANSSETALLATVGPNSMMENNHHQQHIDNYHPHGNNYTEDGQHNPHDHHIACHDLHPVAYAVGSKFVEVKLLLLDEDQVKDKNDSERLNNNVDELEIPGPVVAQYNEQEGRKLAEYCDEIGSLHHIAADREGSGNIGNNDTIDIKMDVVDADADVKSNNAPPAPSATRMFLECITGRSAVAKGEDVDKCGKSSGCDYNDLFLCGSSFPDDICSLLSSHPTSVNNNGDASDKDHVETMENGTANIIDNGRDAIKEEEKEEQRQKHDHHRHMNTTKRARVDARSLSDPPAPIEILQNQEENGVDMPRSGTSTFNNHASHHNVIPSMDQGRDTLHPEQGENDSLHNTKAKEVEGSAIAATNWRARMEGGRPPMYARSMSATTNNTTTIYLNNNKNDLGMQLSSRVSESGNIFFPERGTMIAPPCGRPPTMPPPQQLLQRGRSLQLYPHSLDGRSSSIIPLAFSLNLQRQQSSHRENVAEKEINVVSSSSSDANLSTKENDDDADVGGDSIDGGNTATLPIASLTSVYRERYLALCEEGTFHIRFLDTYQGRNPNSTNGCTVIAPLMCVQYFTSSPSGGGGDGGGGGAQQHEYNDALEYPWNNGISDALINHVIDDQAAAILSEVRNKLNLEQDAFIIPSDVHDHFINEGLLSSAQFVGVCGGNILDDVHIHALKSALLVSFYDVGEEWKNRKIAATLFFHGHVVALHVVGDAGSGDNGCGNDENVTIELIDSLPDPETWLNRTNRRLLSMSSNSSLNWNNDERESLSHWCNEETDNGEWERPMEYDDDGNAYDELPRNAIRVRCTDVDHFNTLVRHYACSKFTTEEQRFCDRTVWEDSSCYCEYSYDPRVFQAFIWAEAT